MELFRTRRIDLVAVLLLLLFYSLLLSSSCVDATINADSYEPGDNSYRTTTNVLRVGRPSQYHTLHDYTDTDWYIIDLTDQPTGRKIMIQTTNPNSSSSSSSTLAMRLYTFNCNRDGCLRHYAESQTWCMNQDPLNVMMFLSKLSNINRYHLWLTGGGPIEYSISVLVYEQDIYEIDNNIYQTNNVLLPGPSPPTIWDGNSNYHICQFHTFTTQNDEDWIQLDFTNVINNRLYEFVTDYRIGTQYDGTKLFLYNNQLHLLAYSDYSDWVTMSPYAKIQWYFNTIDEGTHYYIKMITDNNANAVGNGADFQIRYYPYNWHEADIYESLHDSINFDTTQNIITTIGTIQEHTLHRTGDVDYIILNLTTSNHQLQIGKVISITAGRSSTHNDPPGIRLHIYDSHRNRIYMEQGWCGVVCTMDATFLYTITTLPMEILYIKVDSYVSDTGYYSLSVQYYIPPPPTQAPTEYPTPEPFFLFPTPLCFAKHTIIHEQNKGAITMNDISVGDKVLTSTGKYQTVYSIDHYDTKTPTQFIQIYYKEYNHYGTNNNNNQIQQQQPLKTIEITKNHMIFIQGKSNPVPAYSLKVGDQMKILNDKNNHDNKNNQSNLQNNIVIITKIINNVKHNGFINPLTIDGTIVITNDKIIASSYSAIFFVDDNSDVVDGNDNNIIINGNNTTDNSTTNNNDNNNSEWIKIFRNCNQSRMNQLISHHELIHKILKPYRYICQISIAVQRLLLQQLPVIQHQKYSNNSSSAVSSKLLLSSASSSSLSLNDSNSSGGGSSSNYTNDDNKNDINNDKRVLYSHIGVLFFHFWQKQLPPILQQLILLIIVLVVYIIDFILSIQGIISSIIIISITVIVFGGKSQKQTLTTTNTNNVMKY